MKDTKWHLRFFLTPKCNFSCIYCNPHKLREQKPELTTTQAISILESAYIAGIRKIHWTGGEPTIRLDLLKLMKKAKELRFTEQIITTNGWNLHKILDEAIENGLTRVNISLDTLDKDRFKKLTGMDCLENVLKSIEEATKKVPGYVKVNVVTMKDTLKEVTYGLGLKDNIQEQEIMEGDLDTVSNPNDPKKYVEINKYRFRDGSTYILEVNRDYQANLHIYREKNGKLLPLCIEEHGQHDKEKLELPGRDAIVDEEHEEEYERTPWNDAEKRRH